MEPRAELLNDHGKYIVGIREGAWRSLNYPHGRHSSTTEIEAWVSAYSYLKSKQ
jgi:hypothetical protein